jgi:hypothetical protein
MFGSKGAAPPNGAPPIGAPTRGEHGGKKKLQRMIIGKNSAFFSFINVKLLQNIALFILFSHAFSVYDS